MDLVISETKSMENKN